MSCRFATLTPRSQLLKHSNQCSFRSSGAVHGHPKVNSVYFAPPWHIYTHARNIWYGRNKPSKPAQKLLHDLRQSLYAVVQNCSASPVEFYPIAPDVNPRDLYLSLRARSPMWIQRLSKESLLDLFRFSVENHREMPRLPQLILDDILIMTTWDPDAGLLLHLCLQSLSYHPESNLVPHTKILDIWERVSDEYKDSIPPHVDRETLYIVLISILESGRYDDSTIAFIRKVYPILFTRIASQEKIALTSIQSRRSATTENGAIDPNSRTQEDSPREPVQPELLSYTKSALRLIYHLTMESYDKLALDVFKQLVGEGYIPESAMMQQVEKVPTEAEGAPSISDAEHFTFVVIGTLVKMCLHYGYDQLAHDFMQSLQSTAMFDPVYRAAASKVIGTLLLSGTEKDAELLAGLVTSWAADVASVQPLRDDIIWLLYDFCHHVLRPDLIAFIHGRLSTPVLVDVYPVPQNHALVALLTELNHRNNIIQARNLIRTIFRNNYRVDPFHRANVIYQASQMGFATEARALYERYEHRAHSERVTGSAMLATELVAHFVRISEDQSQKLDKRAQDDARAFAQRVTSNLVASRAEMAKIPRTALNAIAHCHFLLGDLEAGFRTLRVILRRREVPHDNDVNVLLTAAAKYSPRAAVTLLKKALDDNYRASARAYAVLLHYARKSGDDELAEEVLRLAEDRGKMAHLDTTVKNSMIRTQLLPLISGVIQPPDTVRQALQTSFETMTWMKNQHRKVNDSLVHLAIRAAVANYRLSVAFAFWNDFFRGRVFEENDPWFSWEERLLVRIERAVQSGKLPRDKGFAMLNQLKENGITQGWVTDEEGLKREIMPFALPPLPAQEPDVGVQSGDEARSQQLPDHSADPVIPGDVADVDTMNDSLLQ